jgi:uncharacterized membrane protein
VVVVVTGGAALVPAVRHEAHAQGWQAMGWTVVVLLATFFLLYQRVHRYLSGFRMTSLLVLRVLAVMLLVVELFQPALALTSEPGRRKKLAVVVDASGSMACVDEANTPSRYRQSVLAAQNTLASLLAEHYELEYYAYDGKHNGPLGSAKEYDQIVADGTVTDLAAAIGLGSGREAAQIILFSDGIHNGPRTVAATLERFRTPVHPVLVGSTTKESSNVPNVTVAALEGPQTATVNNETVLAAKIRSTAMGSRTVRVQLWQKAVGGATMGTKVMIGEQRLVLQRSTAVQTVEFKYTPTVVGRASLEAVVPPDPDERNTSDNAAQASLLVTDTKLAVLYVEGRARPEVGRLRRALATDPNVNAISMVQVRAGEFELQGTKPGDDLKGLPTNLAQWKRFKVVIIGDLDASFFSNQQQADLEEAVKEGTGLLMIGGQRSFSLGGWGETSLARMLPVDLAKVNPPEVNTKFVPQLTAEGSASAILRNITEFFRSPTGASGSKALPELLGCVALAGPKAGAEVLLVHPMEKINGKPAVVLAVQQYGKGRTGAFAADTTIQWTTAMAAMGKDSPYNRFWGQMVRWLAGQEDMTKKGGPSVTAMLAKDRFEVNEVVPLRSAVADKDGQSTAYANPVWAEVTSPDGKTERAAMTAVKEQVGMYEGTYRPQLAGAYKIVFHAAKDKLDLGKDETGFSINQAAAENERTAADAGTMEEIARLTHGHSPVGISGVAKLADALNADVPKEDTITKTSYGLSSLRVERPVTVTLGHVAAVLFFGAVAVEWLLRRKWQLQ